MDRTLRLVLTLLALVTGFTAAPAQARMCQSDAAGLERVESSGRSGTSAIAAAVAEVQGQAASRDRRERERGKPRPTPGVVVIPSIQLADRLLE